MNTESKASIAGVPEVLRPLLPELCVELRSLAAEGLHQVGQRDMPAVAATAHALKGACMRFSLDDLMLSASNAEEAAKRGDAEETVRILGSFVELLSELSRILDGNPA